MTEGWIEEGLVWQGTRPPEGSAWTEADWVPIPREAFVPVGKERLARAIGRLPSFAHDGEHLTAFVSLLSGLVHAHYARTLDELKADYDVFSPSASPHARDGFDEEELARRERRLVVNFLRVALRGKFRPFTAEQHRRATSHTYLFDLPVTVQWDMHDERLLRSVLEESRGPGGAAIADAIGSREPLETLLDSAPELRERALVLHRGVGIDRTEGLFLWEKLDRLLGTLGRWIVSALPSQGSPPAEGPGDATEERRWVRRKGLANEGGLGALFRRSRLQEPTLGVVIALYRLKPREGWAASGKRLLAKVTRRSGEAAIDRTIWLKVFRDVPLADCEIVFPEKRVHMKAYDKTMMAVTALLGLGTVVEGFFTDRNGNLSFAVLLLVGVYFYKLFSYWWYVRLRYQARLARDLYERNLDNSIGALHYLVDSLEEQELKEATLAYALLREAGTPLTAAELDARAEAFLSESFPGVEVDFEVDDALAKVAEGPGRSPLFPIVRQVPGEPARFEPKPLAESLVVLDAIWDGLFHFPASGVARAAPR